MNRPIPALDFEGTLNAAYNRSPLQEVISSCLVLAPAELVLLVDKVAKLPRCSPACDVSNRVCSKVIVSSKKGLGLFQLRFAFATWRVANRSLPPLFKGRIGDAE